MRGSFQESPVTSDWRVVLIHNSTISCIGAQLGRVDACPRRLFFLFLFFIPNASIAGELEEKGEPFTNDAMTNDTSASFTMLLRKLGILYWLSREELSK